MGEKAERVLAVDDCELELVLLAAKLEAAGFSVCSVCSGRAALDAMDAEDFYAVFLDVEMPGIDGLDVARAMRSNPRTAAARIAMHTSLPEALVRSSFDGYDAFLAKPCTAGELRAGIDSLVASARHRHAGAEIL